MPSTTCQKRLGCARTEWQSSCHLCVRRRTLHATLNRPITYSPLCPPAPRRIHLNGLQAVLSRRRWLSGITFAGVDVVIDSCQRYAVHRGKLIEDYVDKALQEQRAGRAGRTCDGTYIALHPPTGITFLPHPHVYVVLRAAI